MTSPTATKDKTIETQWSWLKSIAPEIVRMDETPLLGFCRPFPWQNLSEAFSKAFSLPNCRILPGEISWKEAIETVKDMPEPRLASCFSFAGLEGEATLWISIPELQRLMALVINTPLREVLAESKDVLESFHKFLCIELTQLIGQLSYDSQLNPRLIEKDPHPVEPQLCQDIWIECQGDKIYARLALSNLLRKSWQKRFIQSQSETIDPSRLSNSLLTMQVEAGYTKLQQEEINKIGIGDFVLLDKLWLSAEPEKSEVSLTLNGHRLFQAKLQQGAIKIVEALSYHETDEETAIEQYKKPLASGSTMPSPEDKELDEKDDEEDFSLEDDEDFDEFAEEDDDPDELDEENEEIEKKPVEKMALSKTPQKSSIPTSSTQEKPGPSSISMHDVPLTMVIEIGRIQLSIQKLLELQPGNLLDLNIHTDEPITLVINGRVVGHGEIVKIGDVLGVRVLDFKP